MKYPNIPDLYKLSEQITEYAKLMHEYKASGVQEVLDEIESNLKDNLNKLKSLPIDLEYEKKEPNNLEEIKALRTNDSSVLWSEFNDEIYLDKLKGAFLGRMAGCILGAPVELYSVEQMQDWANYIGDTFPPIDYWSKVRSPNDLRYNKSKTSEYTRDEMDGVPVDDDIVYTLLGLLIAEEYGVNFNTEQVGKVWEKYLPIACTAEDVALKNLKKNISALEVGEIDNPYCQWIGADIRSDPWGYLAPGNPEKAAEMAYNDAYLSHRRNGIYGEMFFSAVISAAFAVDNVLEALKCGLAQIPSECSLYSDVVWAIEESKNVTNYLEARKAVSERFSSMSFVHTNNNACLTIFALLMHENDFTKCISEVVAMGMDNDCTAATVGSIMGALHGEKIIANHWTKGFNNKVYTYLNGIDYLNIDDVLSRFFKIAKGTF